MIVSYSKTIALIFLARGKHPNYSHAFKRFVTSYRRHPTGINHKLYIIYKGFDNPVHLENAKQLFIDIDYAPIYLSDDGLDIGAYKRAASIVKEDLICFMNTKTEIISDDWLLKLFKIYSTEGVGLVGANGSFESLHSHLPAFPRFPNIHIRSNCFLIDREYFLKISNGFSILSKYDQFLIESGPNSLTRQVLADHKKILIVGADGRGYPPHTWPVCGIMRQPRTSNSLISDDHLRTYLNTNTVKDREWLEKITWGKYRHWRYRWHIRILVYLIMLFNKNPRARTSNTRLCYCGSGVPIMFCHNHPNALELIESTEKN